MTIFISPGSSYVVNTTVSGIIDESGFLFVFGGGHASAIDIYGGVM